jgi:hypothetical protein
LCQITGSVSLSAPKPLTAIGYPVTKNEVRYLIEEHLKFKGIADTEERHLNLCNLFQREGFNKSNRISESVLIARLLPQQLIDVYGFSAEEIQRWYFCKRKDYFHSEFFTLYNMVEKFRMRFFFLLLLIWMIVI